MMWEIEYLPEVVNNDLKKLDGSQKLVVRKALQKVSQNPLSTFEGGYGKPLGNHSKTNLSGLLKVKLKKYGLRIVYKIRKENERMIIVVIGLRSDDEVYHIAHFRKEKYNL